MSQREKEALATLAYAGLLMALVVICWLQHSAAAFPWVAGPISLGYGLFMALTHDAEKRRRGAIYDERDAAIDGKAWRAALNGAVFSFGVYAFAIILVYCRMGGRLGDLSIPLLALPVGVVILVWAASVTWAVATLYQTRFYGMADADRQPSS